jgi:hypothetical protein
MTNTKLNESRIVSVFWISGIIENKGDFDKKKIEGRYYEG